MSMHRPWSPSLRTGLRIAYLFAFVCAITAWSAVEAQSVFRNGFDGAGESNLALAPAVVVLRDDRVATLEMDYDGENAWGQWWTMSGTGADDAGFLVTWWPASLSASKTDELELHVHTSGSSGCLDDHGGEGAYKALQPGARWLVTANRRVQLQPLENNLPYLVRVERINALGEITKASRAQLQRR